MAHRSFMEEIPSNLKRTISSTFDFRGRSTRSELLTCYIATQLLSGLLMLLGSELGEQHFAPSQEMRSALTLLSLLPLPALLARRAHDQDLSGWWALLLPAGVIPAALSEHGNLYIAGAPKFELFWLDASLILAIIGLWVLSLVPPTQGANRYGPDPRLVEASLGA